MSRVAYEQRSILLSLEQYLTSAGWTGITYSDGYQSDKTITNPQVTVIFPPSSPQELQLGRVATSDKLFSRRIIVNAYMESERRAQGIVDVIADFMDLTCVNIVDPSGTYLGYLLCPNSESILIEVLPPIMNMPKLMRWRGAVRGDWEAFYPAP